MLGKRSQIGKLEDAVKEDNRLYIRTNLGYFSRSLMFGDKFTPISGEIGRSYIHPDTADNHLSVSTLFKNKDVLGVFATQKVFTRFQTICIGSRSRMRPDSSIGKTVQEL